MEHIDYDHLIALIKKTCLKSYWAAMVNDKPVPNVANLGAKIGDVAKLERTGEYYGISVRFLAEVKPLLTDQFVSRMCHLLKKEEYVTVISVMMVDDLDKLFYILDQWFSLVTTGYHAELKVYKRTYPTYDWWIQTVRHDPLPHKIQIVDIGQNQLTGEPVVPPEWTDRVFANGDALHEAISQSESRINKPPVTYAIIYSMIIQKDDSILTDIPATSHFATVFAVKLIDGKLQTVFTDKTSTKLSYIKYSDLLIGFDRDGILQAKPKSVNSRSVGLLVSRLQKCIRRGRYASRVLIETIDTLNNSPNYNLPEHHFMLVSAAKQLVWRLFISILEDCRPYQAIDELSLLDLILLTLIMNRCPEYQFTKPILEAIKLTALLAQYNDTINDQIGWRNNHLAKKTPIINSSSYHTALSLALSHCTMMAGDAIMLRKLYSFDGIFEPFTVPTKYYYNKEINQDVILSSVDQHSKTCIILYYQACIPLSLSTRDVANYIWDASSSYNVRRHPTAPPKDKLLRQIQQYLLGKDSGRTKFETEPDTPVTQMKLAKEVKRISFLIMFGTKYKYRNKDCVIAGNEAIPTKMKVDGVWTDTTDPAVLAAYPTQTIYLTDTDPPFGYKWITNKVTTSIIGGKPFVNERQIGMFDGTDLLQNIEPVVTDVVDRATYQHILLILAGLDIAFDVLLDFRATYLIRLVNWSITNRDRKMINFDLVRLTYAKLFNQFGTIIGIGPVDRMGNRTQNAISYQLEGKLWAIFNLFCYLYPATFKPNGATNFAVNKQTNGYIHCVRTLRHILFRPEPRQQPKILPTIKTSLWDHQKESVNKILAGYATGKRGFGDASDVGSGKTLTALTIASNLISIGDPIYSGILVLLPGNKLIQTWADEINKHSKNFNVIFQAHTNKIGKIDRCTVVVSTMGRMRDHPIAHKWLLIIIDECLTVQNKNALWTQEAFVQSLMAKYMIMMSATFFRTRFDKLYYMLRMLQTGLPERREYLDTILLEAIVSKIAKIKRNWTSAIHYFHLDKTTRTQYDLINETVLSTEQKFAKLSAFLISDKHVNKLVMKQLDRLIKILTKKEARCLIYARAKAEADAWSTYLNIPVYPTKGHHCIVTYNDGTYGLNDLVIYNTIIMRPIAPDKIPQIKGRLDRPGQKADKLALAYFIIKETIEEGLILRMNIASQFMQTYIMPLAKFYDISVNYELYLDNESQK